MFARLASLFRPLDTSAVEAEIASARCEQHQVRVHARALRMDLSCGDPVAAIAAIRASAAVAAGDLFNRCFGAPPPTTADMQRLLDRL